MKGENYSRGHTDVQRSSPVPFDLVTIPLDDTQHELKDISKPKGNKKKL